MARDVAAFLVWAAEPELPRRHAYGWAVIGFLLVLTALSFMSYRSIWADKKH
jgi:ubiquinol-cytochrome c reductase cytochrome c1 subunit